jgi:hypothetical protein
MSRRASGSTLVPHTDTLIRGWNQTHSQMMECTHNRLDVTPLLAPPPALQIPQWSDYTSAGASVLGPVNIPQGRSGHASAALGTKVGAFDLILYLYAMSLGSGRLRFQSSMHVIHRGAELQGIALVTDQAYLCAEIRMYESSDLLPFLDIKPCSALHDSAKHVPHVRG